MAVVHLPSQLRQRAGTGAAVVSEGSTLGQVLSDLERRYPGLSGWILDETGSIRRHVNVFVNGERAPVEAAIAEADRIQVLPAISGGG
ncbi:MAG: molybdopterin synthase sulfur carrier subunit [Actinobacteria bacterium]|nr:molybdopterin synthase sulfur carrier subunit [Actinomycetota bacterium]